ncbi:flagellar hook-basal body complex protein FliE [Aneurinibacillus migulanus]|uniref:flagellar hook-basal body complex protein FliE n=1 Tax=Aneurinibacillus migulanus TaxID=47500 RepID=UPI00209ED295|nr:flagellar hook-basal body complex protein FliE [Aneurinibacillus migulanus]MCP1355594.1 flagellar hook-basal body complex protein FliE [Aneurinibacillus migulanus]
MIEKIGMNLPVEAMQGEEKRVSPTPYEATTAFSTYLKNAIQDVNGLQKASDKLNQGLATGQVQDIHQVMIASQKAGVAMDMAMQVRNKAVEAYQEIMRMQI